MSDSWSFGIVAFMKRICVLLALVLWSFVPSLGAASPNESTACSASSVLNALGDAVTSSNDGAVLTAAVAGEKRLARCGNERDAIAAALIAADAYGDTNQPAKRCAILRDAAARSSRIGDAARARSIQVAAKGCVRQ
jgi:hypothetical protein